MSKYSNDPIYNVILHQIKEPIRLCMDHNHYSSAVKLVYCGIDTMAYLNMSKTKSDVTRSDFISWVERYIKFKGIEQLSGLEVYAARCSMLHNHSVYSKLSREGKCRLIGYVDKMYPPVKFNPKVDNKLVMVSIEALADAFFIGIDNFLIDLFSDEKKGKMAEQRLKLLVHYFSVDNKRNE